MSFEPQARTNGTKRRVAITGLGAVTPLGLDTASTWQGIASGRNAAAQVQSFPAEQYSSRFAYEVDPAFALEKICFPEEVVRLLPRAGHFGLAAGLEAFRHSLLPSSDYQSPRTAVVMGVGMPAPSLNWYANVHAKGRYDDASYNAHLGLLPDQLSLALAGLIRAGGGVTTVHTACASSGQAVGEAYEMIAYGDAEIVLTGGSDSMVSPFYYAGFSLLGALSKHQESPTTANRPFDLARDGFVMGEGAGCLILEEYQHALHRGAPILGEIVGYGVSESAYRITDLHPEGRGPIEAMRMALDDAALQPEDIGYVNAHGTSTQLNDSLEALAISKVFAAHPVAVSSTKSMTGHLIAAAGAVELLISLLVANHGLLPPSLNINEQDPACPVRLTPAVATPANITYAMSNSVGFGGSNTAIIVKRGEVTA